MGVGETMGVPSPAIGVSGEGDRLAQITVGGDFAGRHSVLRRSSSPFFGRWDELRERTNAQIHHSARFGDDTSLLRSNRNH